MKRLFIVFAVVLACAFLLTAVPFRPALPPEASESSDDGKTVSAAEESPEDSAEESSEEPSPEPASSEAESLPDEPSSEEPSADASEPEPSDGTSEGSEEPDEPRETSGGEVSKDTSTSPGKLPEKKTENIVQPDDPDEPAPLRDGRPETLLINEVMPKNKAYPIDGEIWDWVELYNNTSSTVNLSSYYLTDCIYELKKYRLPNVKLAPNGYYVLRFGPEIDFSLSADGDESLILSNGTKKICTFKIPDTKKNQSVLPGGKTTPILTPGRVNCPWLGYDPTRELLISEVIPLNTKILHEDGNAYGIIEIQNTSADTPISLKGYALSVSAAEFGKYPLPDITVEPGGFAVFYAAPEGTQTEDPMCIPIPLSEGNRTLYLTDEYDFVTDWLYVPKQTNNSGYGRYHGKDVYFLSNSVGKENTVGYELPSMPVTASVKPGIYNSSFTVELSTPDRSRIYYTTDGSTPTTKSTLYEGPITVSSTKAIRAISLRSGQKTASAPVTFNYMLKLPDFTADVMEVTMAPSDFSYIYKNYLQHTEMKANISFFHNGKEEFNIDCGIKMNGKSSRKLAKKSFQLKFRIEYGASALKYQMFEGLDVKEFKSLVLRSGSAGAAAFRYFINDEFATSIMAEAETTVLAQYYRPVNLYINGEYYGIYFIREKVNEDLVASHTGVSADSVDIVKGMKTLEYGYYKGDWDEIWTFAQKHSMKTEEEYLWMDERVCLQDVMDFYIMQSWTGNTDAGNVRVYRSRETDGKWHWIFFDLDQTFAMCLKTYGKGTVASMLGSCTTSNSEGCSDYNCIFYKMFQNERFREEFRERLQWWLDGPLSVESVQARLEKMMGEIEHDMQYSIPRWASVHDGVMTYHQSLENWLGKIETLRTYWLGQERWDNFSEEYEQQIEKFSKK